MHGRSWRREIVPGFAQDRNLLLAPWPQAEHEQLQQQPEPADADEDASRERQIIEDALAGSRGRVSGPNVGCGEAPSTTFDLGVPR